jgi:GH24 family phage-related lysozyme (muramidase)
LNDSAVILGADPQLVNTWAAVVSAAASVLGLGVLIAAAVLGLRQLKAAEQSRYAQTLIEMSDRWESEPTIQRAKLMAAGFGTPDALRQEAQRLWRAQDANIETLIRVPNFMELLSVMVNTGALSFELVDDWLGELVVDWWERWEPAMRFIRRGRGRERIGEAWENLARRRAAGRGRTLTSPNGEDR